MERKESENCSLSTWDLRQYACTPLLRSPKGAQERRELERGAAGSTEGKTRMEHGGMTGAGQKGTIRMGLQGERGMGRQG